MNKDEAIKMLSNIRTNSLADYNARAEIRAFVDEREAEIERLKEQIDVWEFNMVSINKMERYKDDLQSKIDSEVEKHVDTLDRLTKALKEIEQLKEDSTTIIQVAKSQDSNLTILADVADKRQEKIVSLTKGLEALGKKCTHETEMVDYNARLVDEREAEIERLSNHPSWQEIAYNDAEIDTLNALLYKDCPVCGGDGFVHDIVGINKHGSPVKNCPHCDNGKVRRWVVPGWFVVNLLKNCEFTCDNGSDPYINMEDVTLKFDGSCYLFQVSVWVEDTDDHDGGHWHPHNIAKLTKLPDGTWEIIEVTE